MNAPDIDPRIASEVARLKAAAIATANANNARWVKILSGWFIAGLVVGLGAWFHRDPLERELNFALLLGFSVWLSGVLISGLFDSTPTTPQCPQCGFAWVEEERPWPSWKHCPGCGLRMSEDSNPHDKPSS